MGKRLSAGVRRLRHHELRHSGRNWLPYSVSPFRGEQTAAQQNYSFPDYGKSDDPRRANAAAADGSEPQRGTKKSFADQLQHRGFENFKAHAGIRGYRGIRLHGAVTEREANVA